jgi:hypothetical protein
MTRDFKAKAKDQFKAISKIHDLRAPLQKAILNDFDHDGSFEKRAILLGKQIHSALREFRKGKLSRASAVESYLPELQKLRKDYEGPVLEALWNNSKLHPSFSDMIIALYGKSAIYDLNLKLETDKYLGWLIQKIPPPVPSDAGTVEQGLGGDDPTPPPFNSCAMPPYSIREDEMSSQILGNVPLAAATPQTGKVDVELVTDEAGGSWGHSLLGVDFNIPAGFSSTTATANITWGTISSAWAILGAAGVGGDFLIRMETPPGNVTLEKYTSLFSLISPVAYTRSFTAINVNSVFNATIAMPDTAARTLRVWAGISSHAEAGGLAACAVAGTSGTLNSLCISAV